MSSVEDLEGQATARRAAPPAVTPRSQLHAQPRARAERAERYLLGRPHGEYNADDIRVIVAHYYKTAQPVGLDPLLVIAQMALETGGLTSFWSQRPRRNPAGIGVTGAPGAGVSFPSWKTAVRAHTGRLLAYSLPSGDEDQLQRQLIEEALAHRALPQRFRGVAPRLEGLAGTWAADPQYAVKLARVANEIRTQDL
jgi:flagellum-specific peptidoglycan hydrolase FlgJ